MAIKLLDKGNVYPADSDYPFGDIKDKADGISGTKVNRRNHADFHQFFSKLMDAAGIVYNDLPDNAYNTFQLFEALLAVITKTQGVFVFKASIDCSGNPNYPAASKGWAYLASVAGKIGGASGKSVDAGDLIVAIADNAGGTEGSVGSSWTVIEHNLSKASQAEVNAGSDDAKYITPAKIAGATAIIGAAQAKADVYKSNRVSAATADLNNFPAGTCELSTQAAPNAPESSSSRLFETWTHFDTTTSGLVQKSTIISGTGKGSVYVRFYNGSWGLWDALP